jgi:predicted transcriptional regulator
MFDVARMGKLRKQLGLTQKQLAILSGVSQSLIAKMESGKIDPAYSKVVQISAALENEQNKGKKAVEQIMTSGLVFVSPSDSLEKGVALMRSKDISQLPVMDDGKCIGSLSDSLIVDLISKHRDIKHLHVREVMRESFPVIPASSWVDVATDLLHHYRAVLVEKNGKVCGIITKADLLRAI